MDTTKIYYEIAERGIITEREILLIKRRLNNFGEVLIKRALFGNGPLQITPEQTVKGLDWLLDKYKTPRGVVRKHNPFNQKHIAILENFKKFELVGFEDVSRNYMMWFMPIYRVYSRHDRYFDYVVSYRDKNTPITFLP